MLSEKQLLEILEEVRKQQLDRTPPSERGPYCLNYARAQSFANDPDAITESTRAHVDGCDFCKRLVRSFQNATEAIAEKSGERRATG